MNQLNKSKSKEWVKDEPLMNEADESKYEEHHHCPVQKKSEQQFR